MVENRGVSHRENFVKLQAEFADLKRLNASGEAFESVAMQLLRAFENTRKKNEGQIARIQEEIKFCEATSRACDMFEQLLIGLLGAARVNLEKGLAPNTPPPIDGVVADTDVLKTICVCGCQDEEDTKTCKCLCHQEQHCGNTNCGVCDARFAAKPPVATAVMDQVADLQTTVTRQRRGTRKGKGDAGRNPTS